MRQKKKQIWLRKKLKHGTHFEPVEESQPIRVHETGLVVNPVLFWLGCSPDGLVFDELSHHPLDV